MKKFLLTALAVFSCVAMASAKDVTVDFTNPEALGVAKAAPGEATVSEGFTYEGIKVVIVQGEGISLNQELRFFTADNGNVDFRCSAKGGAKGHKMTVYTTDGANITNIVFDGKNLNVTADPGTLTAKTWTGDAASITFTTTGQVNLNNMVVTIAGAADTRKDADVAFAQSEYTVKLGDKFAAPVATKATTAELTYTSSVEEVATVDPKTGEVEILAAGTTVITATAEANDEFKAGEASYTLIVAEPNVIYSGLTAGMDDWTINNISIAEGLNYVWSWDSKYNYAKASGYYKQAYDTKAAIVSPEIDLTNREEISMSFEMLANYFGDITKDCSVLLSVDGGEFTALEIANWPANDFKAPWTANTIDLNAYAGKKIKVQFLYTSTAEKAGTWEIKNFTVKGKEKQTGIAEIETENADAPVEYFNLQGVRVDNPTSGLFIRRQGNKVTKVIVK